MPPTAPATDDAKPTLLDRALRIFSDVRAGESPTVLLLLVNLFLPLVSYYILKVVREALIDDAESASYATGAQAVVLMILIPIYSRISARVPRNTLVLGVVLFFVACIELFFLGDLAGLDIGFVFFVWVGIFSLMIIAQFWSLANDIYDKESGDRLFPIIVVGQTLGAIVGSRLGALESLDVPVLLQIAAVLLLVHLALYRVIARRPESTSGGRDKQTLARSDGFALVARSPYLRIAALLFLLLNLVNTTGEYILRDAVVERAEAAYEVASAADPTLDHEEFVQRERKAFYGDFFFFVNILTVLLQAFVASRIVKYFGLRGVLFMLPLIAAASYGAIAAGASFLVLRWAKTFENASDYSIMNTGRALLWLPTTRDEKFKAKQVIDTFIVRAGDLLSTGVVALGSEVLMLSREGFAGANLVLVLAWLAVTWLAVREHRALVAAPSSAA